MAWREYWNYSLTEWELTLYYFNMIFPGTMGIIDLFPDRKGIVRQLLSVKRFWYPLKKGIMYLFSDRKGIEAYSNFVVRFLGVTGILELFLDRMGMDTFLFQHYISGYHGNAWFIPWPKGNFKTITFSEEISYPMKKGIMYLFLTERELKLILILLRDSLVWREYWNYSLTEWELTLFYFNMIFPGTMGILYLFHDRKGILELFQDLKGIEP